MIHIRVVKAGEIAVAAALLVLLAVIGVLIAQALGGGQALETSAPAGETPPGWQGSGSAWTGAAEEAQSVFSAGVLGEGALFTAGNLRAGGEALPLRAEGEGFAAPPRVLVYHTHTCESYEREPGQDYLESEPWRTEDQRYSVARVGEELCLALRTLGVEAVHDTTNHEPPALNTAYARSLETLAAYEAAGERFDLLVDLHRDAWVEGEGANTVETAAGPAARVLFLIGQGEGFSVKPDTEANARFALLSADRLNAGQPGICRGVLEKSGRYNQHMGGTAVLVEVGNNRNTLSEALRAVPWLAQALADSLLAEPEPGPILPVSAGG